MYALNLNGRIGNTSLLRLKKIEERFGVSAQIFAKAEFENPGGSVKDRVAFAMLAEAEETGKLLRGGTVIEATSGNTGIGLALAAKARGMKAVIVMPDSMTKERREMIAAYGAEIHLTDGAKGMKGAVEYAERLCAATPNSMIAGQFDNPVCVRAHYETTAPEIFAQTNGETDIFVACVGTGGTLTGIGKYLKEKIDGVRVVAVEPEKSPLLSKGYAGTHGIQGIGANFLPSILDRSVYDEVLTVSDEESLEMAKCLYGQEGLFVGISSGAAVAAAVKLAQRTENAGKKIVTVLPDSGNRYLSVFK